MPHVDADADIQVRLPSGKQIAPLYGVKGYLDRRDQWDALALAFDEGRLAYADRRLVAASLEAKLASRSRDLTRVGALIIGLAAASLVAGERLSAVGWAVAVLAPVLILCGKSWKLTGRLYSADVEATRVQAEMGIIAARRLWLLRTARLVPVLRRRLPSSGFDENAAEVLRKAVAAEKKLNSRLGSSRYSNANWRSAGWSSGADMVRKSAAAAIVVAAANAIAFGLDGRTTVAVGCGALAVVFSVLRCEVSRRVVDRRVQIVNRLAIWNRQRDMLADIDKSIRKSADALVNGYQDQVVIDLR